jgi:WD40 repeat protein
MPENINTLAVGYEDHSIKIWDLRALGKVGKFKDATTTSYDSVKSLCFSKSGRLLFAAYNNNCIKVWDLLTELKVG